MTKSQILNNGFDQEIDFLKDRIKALYLEDEVPWVIGYSGGKDSTAVLQLTWYAIAEIPKERRVKTIHVISTDTLVENPIVALWVDSSLERINNEAKAQDLPFLAHKLTPTTENSFWVNLIGKGYPAPRQNFRWCTDRLKIKPSNTFIMNMVQKSGEVILLLGTRSAESSTRAAVMKKHEKTGVRDYLSNSGHMQNCSIFPVIKDWQNDDVWLYLNQVKNPWGHSNKELMTMYRGATADAECPLVVDTSTQSCGDSRFGCWVCTMVSKDKSMSAMIRNDQEKEWMLPLLELRNELDVDDDRHLRDFRRMNGKIQFYNGRTIHGPYTQESREMWLRKVLEAQDYIQNEGPKDVQNLQLITMDELHEIRKIWVLEKHELEDTLPVIYKESLNQDFPEKMIDKNPILGSKEMRLLKQLCKDNSLQYPLVRSLLSIEHKFRTSTRRVNLFKTLEDAFLTNSFENEEDAIENARLRNQEKLDILSSSMKNPQPKEAI